MASEVLPEDSTVGVKNDDWDVSNVHRGAFHLQAVGGRKQVVVKSEWRSISDSGCYSKETITRSSNWGNKENDYLQEGEVDHF